MMKKTAYITVRTTPAVKELLENTAAEKEWTISHLVEKILQEWADKQEHTPEDKTMQP